MTEAIPVRVESSPPPESSVTRREVVSVVNAAAGRWRGQVDDLHRQIDPTVELDDLADNPRLTPDQRRNFGEYRYYQKGVKGLTEHGDLPVLYDSQPRDVLTTTFNDPETGEVYTREEGLNIAPLIERVRGEIASVRSHGPTSHFPSFYEERAQELEHELRVLEENSDPYSEVFPDAFDESNPQSRARIAEEARRNHKNQFTATGSAEGDRRVAIERLRASRLLKIPEKAVVPLVPPSEVGRSSAPVIATRIEVPAVSLIGEDLRSAELLVGLAEVPPTDVATVAARIGEITTALREEGARSDPEVARRVNRLMGIRIPSSQRARWLMAIVPIALILLGIGISQRGNFDVAASNRNATATATAASTVTPEPSPTVRALPTMIPYEQNPFYKGEPTTTQSFRDGMGLLENPRFKEANYKTREDYNDKIDPNNKDLNIYPKEGYSVKGMVEADIAEVINPDLKENAEKLEAEGKVLPEDDPRLSRTLELLEERIDSYYGDGTYDNMISDFTERMKKALLVANESPSNPQHRVLMTPYHLYTPEEIGANGLFSNEKVVEEATARANSQIVVGRFQKWEITDEDFDRWFALETFNWDFTQGKNLNVLNPKEWRRMTDEINQQLAAERLQ